MANCQDFTITLKNSTDAEIKATKFEYLDGSNWKVENLYGLDGSDKIEKDHSKVYKRDLGGIGDEDTCFRVTYQHHIGGLTWSVDKIETTSTFKCHDNGKITVILTK